MESLCCYVNRFCNIFPALGPQGNDGHAVRFRSGEGSLDESGTREILYGTEGQAPWGAAEYGDGTEMTLRYVTRTERGEDVELMLRYRDTVLEEIILHTLEKDEQ